MFSNIGIPGLILIVVIFALIILFMVSFILFIRRLLINSTQKNKNQIALNEKLDFIIEKMN
ncbi:DUF4083 family protein [Peribacillus psychrosaccharolyticus]|uniref:DUF4083 family protein n=1 Tax=Peribacillus psychrosaccharolyticus TaxID=1407 RepID=A0A974S1K6_PERPY|nr:DUF4083 family protein [Peribacillus psychrosaccharolyticus]MEC2056498.1 DUF4083 family protein [Peribacillus psychrosaccharolyticus]MED3745630.1 DUF4083 family protein [Peribacillus psychrosaccharolyticus]QQT00355.1 DUF4083 family protein [Peribacillus psychrosaccharolyticus]